MSLEKSDDCTELVVPQGASLREENRQLRHKLKMADALAARYTTLLREGNHRIKNSLQIVSSLMTLQAGREADLPARQALLGAAGRIQSIGRMHDALQESGGEDSVNLGAILEIMCASLHDMGGDTLSVSVRVKADPFHAPVAFVQPIVLAMNELVVNALRHAFPDERAGAIDITLRHVGGQLRMVVSDDGVGMPTVPREGQGYGMTLVRMMINQVDGALYVDSGAGTRITMVVPAPDHGSAPVQTMQPSKAGKGLMPLLKRRWNANGRG